MNKRSWREGSREKEGDRQAPSVSGQRDAGKEGTRGRTRRPGLILPDRFAITVQIIIPLPSTSIDMSLRIYILRGYDLETDTADLPYRVTRGINPGEAGQDREVRDDEENEERKKERETREGGKERNSRRVFMEQKNIDRSCVRARTHTCVKNDSFNNR